MLGKPCVPATPERSLLGREKRPDKQTQTFPSGADVVKAPSDWVMGPQRGTLTQTWAVRLPPEPHLSALRPQRGGKGQLNEGEGKYPGKGKEHKDPKARKSIIHVSPYGA